MNTTASAVPAAVNTIELESKVKQMYEDVANNPHGDFHFAMGRSLTESLGYAASELDRIPTEAVDSFAGVGCPLLLADIREGATVLDLGSGSGTDAFMAALRAGPDGPVHGVDMTEAQRKKASDLAVKAGFANVHFHAGYIESPPIADATVDVVISNGVINLSPDKSRVFKAVARVLRNGGRFSISDIVTEKPLPSDVTCNATLWAACIGGAMQEDDYQAAIEAAGLRVVQVRTNPQYVFLTDSARGAAKTYGVKSINLCAVKDA